MMKRRAWFVASLLSVSGLISAQSPFTMADVPIDEQATDKANRYRRVLYEGKKVFENVRKLKRELTWHKDLETAAAAAGKSGKPIVLIQALGDLKGYV
jgi:hypothetical protein